MGQRLTPAPFLTKTYELVDDRSSDDVVSWNDNGTTFVVWKMADFAKDMLPVYFKHNNFSSFVRQLNTYGFKKTAPDKWEFANDKFKKGHKHLLIEIRRRKPVNMSPVVRRPHPKTISLLSNSGEELAYGSDPDSKNPGSSVEEAVGTVKVTGLTDENEKLKRDNEMLSSELAHVKKQCNELTVYITERIKVGPEQLERIMRELRSSSDEGLISSCSENKLVREETVEGGEGDVKLFGVWVKNGERKRVRDETWGTVGGGPRSKESKKFESPWMKISSCPNGVNRVCN